jgi:hypothetical protein
MLALRESRDGISDNLYEGPKIENKIEKDEP